jgi:hypothetical protein
MKREDAIEHNGRYIVPTRPDTAWVATLGEFKAAGGIIHFSEDQTEITLTLPVGSKFSIKFLRPY